MLTKKLLLHRYKACKVIFVIIRYLCVGIICWCWIKIIDLTKNMKIIKEKLEL